MPDSKMTTIDIVKKEILDMPGMDDKNDSRIPHYQFYADALKERQTILVEEIRRRKTKK